MPQAVYMNIYKYIYICPGDEAHRHHHLYMYARGIIVHHHLYAQQSISVRPLQRPYTITCGSIYHHIDNTLLHVVVSQGCASCSRTATVACLVPLLSHASSRHCRMPRPAWM